MDRQVTIVEEYSRQFIAEVEKHVSPTLVDFFKANCENRHFEHTKLRDCINATMMQYFKGKKKGDELQSDIAKAQKNRWQQRYRWYTSYVNYLMFPANNSDDPLNLLKMDADEAYEVSTNEINMVNEWKKVKHSLLVMFPAIRFYSDESVYGAFKLDLILDIWDYIKKELHGNIDEFFSSYVEALLEKPIFSASSFNLNVSKSKDSASLQEVVLDDNDDSLVTLTIPNNKFTPPKAMDVVDLKILSTFISSIDTDFYKNRTVIIDLGVLVKSVIDYNPGDAIIESVKNRCTKLVEYSHTVELEDGVLSFNFFDNVIVRDNGIEKPHVIATFGEVLTSAIIQKALISVARNNFILIQNNPMSQIMYFAFQRERIALYSSGRTSCSYSYTYFQKIVRFKQRNKKKNLKLIEDGLKGFVENNICIKAYTFSDDMFLIEYLPLTEEEKEDLNLETGIRKY